MKTSYRENYDDEQLISIKIYFTEPRRASKSDCIIRTVDKNSVISIKNKVRRGEMVLLIHIKYIYMLRSYYYSTTLFQIFEAN